MSAPARPPEPQVPSPPVMHEGRPDEGPSCRYRLVRSTRFTQRAFDFLQDGHLTLRDFWAEGQLITLTAEGPCPRCFHEQADTVHPTAVSEGDVRALQAPSGSGVLQLVFVCQCDQEHEGRTGSEKGCGLRYRVEADVAP